VKVSISAVVWVGFTANKYRVLFPRGDPRACGSSPAQLHCHTSPKKNPVGSGWDERWKSHSQGPLEQRFRRNQAAFSSPAWCSQHPVVATQILGSNPLNKSGDKKASHQASPIKGETEAPQDALPSHQAVSPTPGSCITPKCPWRL